MLQHPAGRPLVRRAFKWRLTGVLRCVSFALVYLQLLAYTCGGSADQPRTSRSLAEYRPGPKDSADQLLVVTLLGGHVVAVRPDSGEVLWEYDTGTPLVRVNQGKAMPPGLHMFPGVDGGLYLYTNVLAATTTTDGPAAPPAGPTLERLPITLPELVDTSPSLTDDGSIITGERRTSVFALDRLTGSLLHVFSEGAAAAAAGGPLAEAPDPLLRSAGGTQPPPFGMEDVPVLHMLDPDRILLVGRQDYVVRSKQVLTDVEAWNATYSRLIHLRTPGLGLPTRVPGTQHGEAGSPLPLFTVGADHTLQAYDPSSRIRRWSVRFKTPPVSVFASEHGDTNFLDPTAVQPLRNPDPAARATGRVAQQRGRGRGAAAAPPPVQRRIRCCPPRRWRWRWRSGESGAGG